ncbi:ubiquitin-conjugating enzyme E2 [Trifolium repens]|nr:ubiquitin-conjugating enzyme E2 [Trifolium repens]
MASQASLLLQKQLKDLCKNPVDGFSAGLVDETNIFEWSVTIIGPPDTLYEGGFFNAIMSFPSNYPNSPPSVKFTSEIWHPNVYPDGRVCISILHPPGDDPNGYELASERWTPVHTVESIVLSIISMLSGPNDESPANVEAAKMWRENREEFRKRVGSCFKFLNKRILVFKMSVDWWMVFGCGSSSGGDLFVWEEELQNSETKGICVTQELTESEPMIEEQSSLGLCHIHRKEYSLVQR